MFITVQVLPRKGSGFFYARRLRSGKGAQPFLYARRLRGKHGSLCFGMFAEAEGNAPPFFYVAFCPARRHNGRAAQIYIVTEYAGAAFDKLSFFSAQKDKF